MAAFKHWIEYHGMDEDYLLVNKNIHHPDGQVNTPFAAQVPGRWTRVDQPFDEVRGFNEIYLQVTSDSILEGNRDLESEVRQTLSRTDDGEINVVFVAIRGEDSVESVVLERIVELQHKFSAYFAVPFQPDIVDAVNSDDREINEDVYVSRYREPIDYYFAIVDRTESESPEMGVVLVLHWGYTRELVQEYIRRNVLAFCVNFNGRSPLVQPAQIDHVISPLQAELKFRGLDQDGFLYAINAGPGRRDAAEDFLAVVVGFDGIGGYHVPPYRSMT